MDNTEQAAGAGTEENAARIASAGWSEEIADAALEDASSGQRTDGGAREEAAQATANGGLTRRESLRLLLVAGAGLAGGYVIGVRRPSLPQPSPAAGQAAAQPTTGALQKGATSPTPDAGALARQVLPPEGYTLPVHFGDAGPQLLAAGAFDLGALIELYKRNNQPLSDQQIAVLRQASDRPVVIDQANAYFLLNFLWALGLTNFNPILKDGPMAQYSQGKIEGFASTGGWTLAQKPVTALYSSTVILRLTPEQQANVETLAQKAYRPCCNNPTSFPDCNHGMALLGLLELMAAQGAGVNAMFAAAKQANSFWFPQQAFEVATYLQATEGKRWQDVEPAQAVGAQLFSAQGSQRVTKYLEANNLRDLLPGEGGSCGV